MNRNVTKVIIIHFYAFFDKNLVKSLFRPSTEDEAKKSPFKSLFLSGTTAPPSSPALGSKQYDDEDQDMFSLFFAEELDHQVIKK
jgi:hypothetical protein